MSDFKVQVNLDELTIGDLELLESGSMANILKVFDRLVTIDGVDYRTLHYTELKRITEAIRDAVQDEANPTVDGKN